MIELCGRQISPLRFKTAITKQSSLLLTHEACKLLPECVQLLCRQSPQTFRAGQAGESDMRAEAKHHVHV